MKLSMAVVATKTLTTGRAELCLRPGVVGFDDMIEKLREKL
jgi:hypothetical protein